MSTSEASEETGPSAEVSEEKAEGFTAETLYGDDPNPKEDGKSVEAEAEPEAKEESKESEQKEEVVEFKRGEESVLSDEQFSKIEKYAKDNELSPEASKKYLDSQEELLSDFQKSQVDYMESQIEGWKNSLKNDKEFGGDNYGKNVELAKRAFTQYADQDTIDLFNKQGYGNYPGLVKLFAKIGAEMGEDSLVSTNQSGTSQKSPEELFYGNTTN